MVLVLVVVRLGRPLLCACVDLSVLRLLLSKAYASARRPL